MKKNILKVVAATSTLTLVGGSLATTVFADNSKEINIEDVTISRATTDDSVIIKPGAGTTTDDSVQVEDKITLKSSIPNEIIESHGDFFNKNNVSNIQGLVDKIYESIDGINVKNNPNFSTLENGKVPYEILNKILEDYKKKLDDTAKESIIDAIDIYDVYRELSKDGGFLYYSNTSEDCKELSDKLEAFVVKYDYSNATKEKFKNDLEKELSSIGNYTFEYFEDYSQFIIPTTTNTGYIYIDGKVYLDGKEMISFSFETVLKKISSSNNNSSSGSSGGSSSSGSHSSSSGSSSSSNSSNNTTSDSDKVTDTSKVKVSISSVNGIIRLVDEKGQAVIGWQQVDGKWYLADEKGQALTGWQQVNGKWYYLKSDGAMATTWYKDENGKWYYLNESGDMKTGWHKDSNGKWYYLNESGDMKTGWYKDKDGKWYYLNQSGDMKTGWYKDTDGKWYYLNESGDMAKDTYINGYYLGSDGVWEK